MSGVEKPVYIVAVRDTWCGTSKMPKGSLPAFGSLEEAEAFAKDCQKQDPQQPPLSLFRVVEYRVSRVTEL